MIRRELRFLLALWKTNLLSAMEYRIPFISQVVGMMLNNAVYFLFWVIFFDRFQEVRGWGLNDMFLLFGIVAAGVGLGTYLFGNVMVLSEVIAGGRLDYYLSLPRPVLLHCASGKRAGAMTLMAISATRGLDGDAALALGRAQGLDLTTEQIGQFVKTYADDKAGA